jgi:nitrate reductase alpha subunit
VRRFYGDRRVKKPMVRKGFMEWVQAGFPRDPKTGAADPKYMQRGRDGWVAASWDEAFELAGKALTNIAQTYTGEEGKQKLLAQGYDPLMVEATQGAGTQTLKFRGGMPALGVSRVFVQYRIANAMALLDDKIRGQGEEKSLGARGFDNYSWHTDLPPGHPMVTGQQTVDFDLCNAEYCNLLLVWGMNWITTKMPDSHWLTEARMKGTKVVVITVEYSATASKADEVIVVRPGTTPALALSVAQVLMSEKLYDEAYVKANTDLPLLVRTDTGEMLRASDVFSGYQLAALDPKANSILKDGEKAPPAFKQASIIFNEKQRQAWGDFVMWDDVQNQPVAINRDQVGKNFAALNLTPKLSGEVKVKLASGQEVACRTVFDATKQLLDESYTPEQVEKLIWAPAAAIRGLAKQIAENMDKTLFAMGMGPNQFFNSDLKDRSIFLIAALTRNLGKFGGNVGSYAGNYRASFFNGLPQYIAENPFQIEADPSKPSKVKQFWKGESVHYFNHGDTILRMGDHVLTGKTHIPTPTKAVHVSNSNSLIGNVKGHYDFVINTLSRVEFIAQNEWWWTGSCEYADIVFAVDSWAEMKYPDLTMSVTNPFLYTFPATPLKRIHDTRSDVDVAAGVCKAVGKATADSRHDAYWQFVENGGVRPYLQRVMNFSNAIRGFTMADLEAKAAEGIPAIIQTRTYPKVGAWEQGNEDRAWYTKTGRLEFYREEPEFRDSGENMVIFREPIDSTFYEPNVIVAQAHPLLRPKGPKDYGVDPTDVSGDMRQGRHVIKTVEEVLASKHPLLDNEYKFIFHTPKYRHGAHTTAVDTDVVAAWFGSFGDMLRRDKRMPFVTEAYVDINPLDAKELGIEEGDYIYIDADPHDRPFRNWKNNPEGYKVARLLVRTRYYAGTPRGVTRMWHNMYGASFGSVKGAETNPTGLAKSPDTGYQSLYRSGSHQSCTRGWLKPTWMTDTLYIKGAFGQQMTQGFVADVHCPTGAPREAFVKITKAEDGGMGGKGLWRPAQLGMRPTYENDALKQFIAGKFIVKA